MATLDILTSGARPALIKIDVPLARGEMPCRLLYGVPSFVAWLSNDLPSVDPGRLGASETPQEQLDYRFYQWIAGHEIKYNRMFKDLMPAADEVWEMKTVDVRVFGWMDRSCIFIAVFGDYADLYKGPRSKNSYSNAISKVKEVRRLIDLDDPKFKGGTFDELVCV
jgi:hypothetical protein